MPRTKAASTMELVDGPKRMSSSKALSWDRAASMSNAVLSHAAWHRPCAKERAKRPTSSSVYSTTTWYMPASGVRVVRLNVTGQPAAICMCKVASSMAWAMLKTAPCWVVRNWPKPGNRWRKRCSKSGTLERSHSWPWHWTMASMAVWRVHRLGPRRARMREMSIRLSSLLFLGIRIRFFGGNFSSLPASMWV